MDKTEFVIWKPERNGHAPEGWKPGMSRRFRWLDNQTWSKDWNYIAGNNHEWLASAEYLVPAEALNGPPAKVDFNYATWRAEGLANQDKLPAGIVLPEPEPEHADWANEMVKQFNKFRKNERGILSDFLRAYCQPKMQLIP